MHAPVEAVAVVGVDGENSETGFYDGAVIGTVEDGAGHFRRQPRLPKQCYLIIQPRNIKLIVNVGLREPEEREQEGGEVRWRFRKHNTVQGTVVNRIGKGVVEGSNSHTSLQDLHQQNAGICNSCTGKHKLRWNSRINGVSLMVAKGGENRSAGEIILDHLHSLPYDLQVAFP